MCGAARRCQLFVFSGRRFWRDDVADRGLQVGAVEMDEQQQAGANEFFFARGDAVACQSLFQSGEFPVLAFRQADSCRAPFFASSCLLFRPASRAGSSPSLRRLSSCSAATIASTLDNVAGAGMIISMKKKGRLFLAV
jgi:hypothetical protein